MCVAKDPSLMWRRRPSPKRRLKEDFHHNTPTLHRETRACILVEWQSRNFSLPNDDNLQDCVLCVRFGSNSSAHRTLSASSFLHSPAVSVSGRFLFFWVPPFSSQREGGGPPPSFQARPEIVDVEGAKFWSQGHPPPPPPRGQVAD